MTTTDTTTLIEASAYVLTLTDGRRHLANGVDAADAIRRLYAIRPAVVVVDWRKVTPPVTAPAFVHPATDRPRGGDLWDIDRDVMHRLAGAVLARRGHALAYLDHLTTGLSVTAHTQDGERLTLSEGDLKHEAWRRR